MSRLLLIEKEEMSSMNTLRTTESSGLHNQKYSKYHHRTIVELLLPYVDESVLSIG
jgi:hypothetical protein